MLEPLRVTCQGKWLEILAQFGLDRRVLSGKHVPCPMCGGRDRFRFDNKDGHGTWFCTHCGAGGGAKLAMHVSGLGFADVAKRCEAAAGVAVAEKPRREMSSTSRRKALNELWRHARSPNAVPPVWEYLKNRTGVSDAPVALRGTSSLTYRGDVDERYPALIAMVTGPDGIPATLHRTFLAPDGSGKAPIERPRMLMPGPVPKGAAIRLADYGEELGIAEGIETALVCPALFGVPTWSVISAGQMLGWVPPAGVRRVWIFGDNDASFTGQSAAYMLAKGLKSDGYDVFVRIPDELGTDWNDVWKRANSA